MLRLSRDRLGAASPLRLGAASPLAQRLSCGALALLLSCGSAQKPGGSSASAAEGVAGRIERRALSDRPPLAIIEREGDPEIAIGLASLAPGAPELHAELGQLLSARLTRAGFHTQLTVHGLGFELTLLGERGSRAALGMRALLQALQASVTSAELGGRSPSAEAARAAPSAVSQCSAELGVARKPADAAQLEKERAASFAQDRAALSVVGDAATASAVADALEDGPDWPELGRVRPTLPDRNATQVVRGERAGLAVALTVADPNRALSAAATLGASRSALEGRLAALGSGFRLKRVSATAHPTGACLRIDSDVDASPLPEPRRLGFAISTIEEEAALALSEADGENRLEASALSAADPRAAARAAAYRALVEPGPEVPPHRLVALTTSDEGPTPQSLDEAIEQARAASVPLDVELRLEPGQAGFWALAATPCAAMTERSENAGHAALFLMAASAGAPEGVRLEPWVGAGGVGLLGFVERAVGETDAQAAARLGDALGQALVVGPSAQDVATARDELVRAAGGDAHPLWDGLLDALAPGHFGALAPRGSVTSLQAASREAILARQRELLRLPHRLAVLSPSKPAETALLAAHFSRWLKGPEPLRPTPCATEVSPPARGELSLAPGASAEGSYLAFRISAKAGSEASLLAELLNLPGGALERALADPDLVGAARALSVGSSSARALIIQVSAFEGREAEALSRIQKLFERLAAGGVLTGGDIESAAARQRAAHRFAALDPRLRLMQLLEPVPTPADANALRRLAAGLRPEAAIIAHAPPRIPTAPARTPATPPAKPPAPRK